MQLKSLKNIYAEANLKITHMPFKCIWNLPDHPRSESQAYLDYMQV